jgi:hypothetical protein
VQAVVAAENWMAVLYVVILRRFLGEVASRVFQGRRREVYKCGGFELEFSIDSVFGGPSWVQSCQQHRNA